jgi:hypothetical protein
MTTNPDQLKGVFGDQPADQLEGQWRTFLIGTEGPTIVLLRSLDDPEGQHFGIRDSKPTSTAVTQLFSKLPGQKAALEDVQNFISSALTPIGMAPCDGGRPIGIGVLDVGQGSAAFLYRGECVMPLMYLDMGGGVAYNAKTFPANGVRWCFTAKPGVLLSHWHWDHWAGATYGGPSNTLGPRKAIWLVPPASLGPLGTTFVARIHAASGTVFHWPPCLAPVSISGLTIGLAKGAKWNDSGLVMLAELEKGRLTLVPGDAAYAFIPPPLMPEDRHLKTLLIAHHGGHLDASPPTAVPIPDGKGNCFAYCSVGHKNTHGHPSELAAHGAWTIVRTDARLSGANAVHLNAETGKTNGTMVPSCCGESSCSLSLHA